ncbi:hypothetical protein [uncultured Thiocystis sp.]|jgi:hypothetical protein|uniref:hypothetical protein n=1 Tax=uncultured Thiocystis sp. TaxID=1202134 RepID=UPI0025D8A451|nr:hypothetical protein [uncultured Thiocystis sp.]
MTQIRIKHDPPTPLPDEVYHGRKQQAKPLTHHEILSLMAPFTQRGRHVDLAASDRGQRRLVFHPIEHPPTDDLPIAVREVLSLEIPDSGNPWLARTVSDGSGLLSAVAAVGPDAGSLLEQIEAVPIQRQFRIHSGIWVARSYLIEWVAGEKASLGAFTRPVIVEARARVAGVNLELKADRYIRHSVEIRLTADPDAKLMIPEDLLAVLGWNWRPLREFVDHWRGNIRVPAKEPKRTADIEDKLDRTITHLARTLDQSPNRFHPRHQRARWRVTFQRLIPLSIGLALLALTPAIQWIEMEEGSILRLLIFNAPLIILVGLFMLREMPRIEVPPIPRPLPNAGWLARTDTPRAGQDHGSPPVEAAEP